MHPGFWDRHYSVLGDHHLPRVVYTVNGRAFPNGPMFAVHPGDLVEVTFRNRTFADHPMHLHGHHFVVLAHNGHPLTGSPIVLDTLNVEPGSSWTIAFRADNPGVWMFHCHNLGHAAIGLDAMVGYTTVTTPYTVGRASGNIPE
jgi:FtsP/CotA-like multicopper oxidase with cupredoxin domain